MNLPLKPRGDRTILFERSDRPGLIFKPRVEQLGPQSFRVVGKRDDPRTTPWGFWGGVLAVTVGLAVLAYEGLTGLWAFWELVLPIAIIVGGLLLLRFGARSSLTEEPCAEVDLAEGRIRLLSSTESLPLPDLAIDDIVEVVFGMTRYPVSEGKDAPVVDAYSLLVRHHSDTLVPVVEVSPDKDELFGVARFIASVTRQPLTQVGIGVK